MVEILILSTLGVCMQTSERVCVCVCVVHASIHRPVLVLSILCDRINDRFSFKHKITSSNKKYLLQRS